MGEVGAEAPNSVARYTKAKISVWWNLESCHVPKDCKPAVIGRNIHSALVRMNYYGPVSAFAYGDTTKLPESVRDAFRFAGFPIRHVPPVEKDAISKTILVDMLLWATDNPAPANLLLISGGDDFSYGVCQLFMRRYNILLARSQTVSTQIVSTPLVRAAKSVWLWNSLSAGGPPLSDGELQQLRNSNSDDGELQQLQDSNSKSSSETLQVPDSNDTQTQQQEGPNYKVHDGK